MAAPDEPHGPAMYPESARSGSKRARPVDIRAVRIEDSFWSPRLEQLRTVTLPTQWAQLEEHHYLDNFRIVAGSQPGVVQGLPFFDSDLYKWLEAALYTAAAHPHDDWVRGRIDEAVELIGAAQQPDGYLNTYHQAFAPEKRWAAPLLNHQLYCAGHLIEAACAAEETGGPRSLFEIGRRVADNVVASFGPDRLRAVPGHEEIELALLRLGLATGRCEYRDLAGFFVRHRGRSNRYPQAWLANVTASLRVAARAHRARVDTAFAGGAPTFGFTFGTPAVYPRVIGAFASGSFLQDARPIEELEVAEGHAVRAMYFLAGAAQLAADTDDAELVDRLWTIWRNTVDRRSYVTGGMGSLPVVEGFGRDYELPNRSYAETCAAIGSLLFSWRLLLLTGDARCADWIERTLYNAIISGVSLDGRDYFYQNPLESHAQDERRSWYAIACCPPNIARLLGSLGRYIYSRVGTGIRVDQYIGSRAVFDHPDGPVHIELDSELPWDGNATVRLRMDAPTEFDLSLRIPRWSQNARVRVNDMPVEGEHEPATYLALAGPWRDGDTVSLSLGMPARLESGDAQVEANRGRAVLERGPLVYCVEGVDNPGLDIHAITLDTTAAPSPANASGRLRGVTTIRSRTTAGHDIMAIPYFAWCNRGPTDMAVWLATNRPRGKPMRHIDDATGHRTQSRLRSLPARSRAVWHPERFQGIGRHHDYFEGWYFKVVDATAAHKLAVIPGVSLGSLGGEPHSFVQILDGANRTASYHRYDLDAFSYDPDHFRVEIADNRFDGNGIELAIDDADRDVSGRLSFTGKVRWPVRPWSPGIMGWYRFVPTMECYHGVVSLDHEVDGALTVDGATLDFDGGRGYIEKDWGTSFPSAWIWTQTNHFDERGASFTASVAKIPWRSHFFTGFIVGLWAGAELYRFATYTGARLDGIDVDDAAVRVQLSDRNHVLEYTAPRTDASELASPVVGAMTGRMAESMTSNVDVSLRKRSGATVFEGRGANAALEVAGDMHELRAGMAR